MASLYLDNDNDIVIRAMRNVRTNAAISDATWTATVYDATGAAVTGATNISLTYVAGSSGDYRGVVPASAALSINTGCRIVATCSNYGAKLEITADITTR